MPSGEKLVASLKYPDTLFKPGVSHNQQCLIQDTSLIMVSFHRSTVIKPQSLITNDAEAAFAALYEIISASPLNVSFLTAGLQLQPWIQSLVDRTPGMSLRILQSNGAFVQLPTELLKNLERQAKVIGVGFMGTTAPYSLQADSKSLVRLDIQAQQLRLVIELPTLPVLSMGVCRYH